VAGFVLLVLWLVALLTYSPLDAAWSNSGTGGPVLNRVGRLGAWLADLSYFLLGFSVWWCLAAGLRAWLTSLAHWMRGQDPAAQDIGRDPLASTSKWASLMRRLASSRAAFWIGLAVLLCASTSLEWSRLYRFDELLPGGRAGGVLGYLVGPASMKWLALGSGLVAIALGVMGRHCVPGFPGPTWPAPGRMCCRRVLPRKARDRAALGQQAAREREW
jgi:S-DNA-T family DNA segregation ATPase FtsK/SpoIIIE